MKRTSADDSDNDTVCDDDFLAMEDAAASEANTLNFQSAELLGVAPSFLAEWREGVVLEGAEKCNSYFLPDYPNLHRNLEVAAAEIDRLTALKRIFWYPSGKHPSNLCVCPANIVLKGSRPRIVHDWTKAGLNPYLLISDVHYGTMDSFLEKMQPAGYMAGLEPDDFPCRHLTWRYSHSLLVV